MRTPLINVNISHVSLAPKKLLSKLPQAARWGDSHTSSHACSPWEEQINTKCLPDTSTNSWTRGNVMHPRVDRLSCTYTRKLLLHRSRSRTDYEHSCETLVALSV